MRLLLAAVLLVALAPAASAQEDGDPKCIIFFEASPDFRLLDVRADLILTDEERENLARLIDADEDGVLTREEVADFEASSVRTVTQTEEYGERLLYMDGNAPTQMTTWTVLRNWTGPVAEAQKGVVAERREYHMRPGNDVGHLLSGGLYASPQRLEQRRPVIETIVITAPEGWVVWSAGSTAYTPPAEGNATGPSPTPYAYLPTTPFKERVVTLEGFDIRGQYEVLFAKEGENPLAPRGSPGAPPLVLAAAVAALALLTRGARRRAPAKR